MDMRRQASDNGMADVPAAPHRGGGRDSGGGMLSRVLAILLIVVSVVALG